MPFLPSIAGFTVGVPDLETAVHAYHHFLDYELTWQGKADSLADLWGLPEQRNTRVAQLVPKEEASGFVRLVQVPSVDNFVPFRYPGWNAAEIAVADVDALAQTLADSPFRILGPPAELSISDDIRAMQVEGPGGELLYLTQIKAPIPGFELPILKQGVGHCFVGIVAGTNASEIKGWYRQQFGLADSPLVPARVQGLSLAFDLDREHKHPICALAMAPGFLIEIDQMPAADPRPSVQGLPAGIISLSLSVATLDEDLTTVALPDGGAIAAQVTGNAGEWLELFISPDP
ncbi:MAG: hypothetical protein AB8B96_16505 [Lysobacterales bacterium]